MPEIGPQRHKTEPQNPYLSFHFAANYSFDDRKPSSLKKRRPAQRFLSKDLGTTVTTDHFRLYLSRNNVSRAALGCCRMSGHRSHTKDETGSSHHAHPSDIRISRHLSQQLVPEDSSSFIQAKEFGSERRFFNANA